MVIILARLAPEKGPLLGVPPHIWYGDVAWPATHRYLHTLVCLLCVCTCTCVYVCMLSYVFRLTFGTVIWLDLQHMCIWMVFSYIRVFIVYVYMYVCVCVYAVLCVPPHIFYGDVAWPATHVHMDGIFIHLYVYSVCVCVHVCVCILPYVLRFTSCRVMWLDLQHMCIWMVFSYICVFIVCVHVYMSVWTCVCVCMVVCAHAFTCMRVCLHIWMYVCLP